MATVGDALARAVELHARGELARAEQIYREVLVREPRNAAALHRLGIVALQRARVDEALALFEQAIQGDPTCVEAHYHHGLALSSAGRVEDAIDAYRRALAIAPDHVPALGNLGALLQANGDLDEAERCFRRALEREPNNAATHFFLGTLAKDRGEPAAAVACYDEALRLDPRHAQARAARGAALLSLGQLRAGWLDYEHRIGCPQFNTLKPARPSWDGSPLAGKTLLVHCEQGLGDTLQFIRYARLAEQRVGKVVIAAQPALIPLLAQSGFPNLASREGPLPPCDVHAPLLSLPRIFETELATIPRDVPYLQVPDERIVHWRAELARHAGFKIAIACQGNQQFRGDRDRSIPVEQFAVLSRIPKVRLISLQARPTLAQAAGGRVSFDVVDFGDALDRSGAFLDSAAILRCVDLVITSDTAIAHLAGALAARVWVALSTAPDWRWMRDRDDSPWYPTMRLFRQTTPGDWPSVFDALAREVRSLIERGAA